MDILLIYILKGGIFMELDRMKHILNNDDKYDVYYDNRAVWIQWCK